MNRDERLVTEEKDTLFQRIRLLLVGAVLGLVPLIMRIHIYDPNLTDRVWFSDTRESFDIFLYWKGIVLVTAAVFMTLLFLYGILTEAQRLKGEIWLIPLVGYAAMCILSTLFSENRYFGINGIYEQHESLWVLLSYTAVTAYTYLVINNERSIKFLIKTLAFLAVVLSFIGLTQLVGKDFFMSDFAKKIMIPDSVEKIHGIRERLRFSFSDSGNHQVYLTMYNPNYVGAFSALVLPIFTSLALAYKNMKGRLFWGLMAVINFLLAMGSGSKTFLGSFVVSGIAALVIYRRKIKKNLHLILIFSGILILSATGYFTIIKTNPIAYVKNALATRKNENKLGRPEILKDKVKLTYNGVTFEMTFNEKEDDPALRFAYENGTEIIGGKQEDNTILLSDPALSEMIFEVIPTSDYGNVVVSVLPNGRLAFFKTAEGYHFMNVQAKPDEIIYPEIGVIKDHDAFASGRGYIWSRTFPLLKKHLLLGSGADTYLLEFPQRDYIGKINGGFGSMMITKPHNTYLQIGVQTGMLSLLFYLSVALILLGRTFSLYRKTEIDSVIKALHTGISLGIVGYLVSGIFNDSVVPVAPIYWCLLGAGFAMNRYIKHQEEKKHVTESLPTLP